MTSTTDQRAARLIAASRRRNLDPLVDVPWEIDWQGDEWFQMAPRNLALFGSDVWEEMNPHQRRTYSRHEMAAACATGIFFENLAMQTLLKHLREIPVTDPSHEFLLIEIAEECKHSIMFSRYIGWADTPLYPPPVGASAFHPPEGLSGRAIGYVLLLAVEELQDAQNRATMNDDDVHPVARALTRLHVIEEARHVSFAQSYLREMWSELGEADRSAVRQFAPLGVDLVAALSLNDDVYRVVGTRGGPTAARQNPFYLERRCADLASLTRFLSDIGVIDDEHRPAWIDQGLLAGASVG